MHMIKQTSPANKRHIPHTCKDTLTINRSTKHVETNQIAFLHRSNETMYTPTKEQPQSKTKRWYRRTTQKRAQSLSSIDQPAARVNPATSWPEHIGSGALDLELPAARGRSGESAAIIICSGNPDASEPGGLRTYGVVSRKRHAGNTA
jgi:hypothetical protein